jgi:AAA+ ATPase superfamily predicted ATPase
MFIKDTAREHCLNAIENHIKRASGRGILVTANYGSGKTELLRQIKNNAKTVRVRSLGSLYQVLARIAGSQEAKPMHKGKYLDHRCEHPTTIIIDEAQDLPNTIWPYIKIMMETRSTFVLAGLPELHDFLKGRHPDVLSRLTHIGLEPLPEESMFQLVQEYFEPDAFSLIYGATYDMRVMMGKVESCFDYIKENGIKRVDLEVAMQFMEDSGNG